MTMVEVPPFNLHISTWREPICLTSEVQENMGTSEEPAIEFNYELHGDDWSEKFSVCGNEQQSPINLISPIT